MMALALLAQATALPAPPSDEEVVVMAQKMRMIRVDMKAPTKHGQLVLRSCRITRSSGVPQLDAIPCAVAQECVTTGLTSRKALEQCVDLGAAQRVNAVAAALRAAQ